LSYLDETPHIPVLLDEVLDGFRDIKSGTFVDCTVGYGGHSSAILSEHKDIFLIGIDRDIEAIEFTKKRLKEFKGRFELKQGSFSEVLKELDLSNLSGLLADFGVSSLQLDREDRGFNFNSDKLDMRMDRDSLLSAEDVINGYSLDELITIFRDYGEMREAKKVALEIVKRREQKRITSNSELSQIASKVIKKKGTKEPCYTTVSSS